MAFVVDVIYLCFLCSLGVSYGFEESQQETCHNEQFSAQCPPGHVVVITHALFGHISRGKCVEIDTGHFGCSVDVTASLNEKCSGQNTCRLGTPDELFSDLNRCSRGLGVFLITNHVCVPGVQASPCERITLSSNNLFVSSLGTPSPSESCRPASLSGNQYYFVAKPGQKIEFTTSVLSWGREVVGDEVNVGFLLDEVTQDVDPVDVLNTGEDEGYVMISESHSVTLSLHDSLQNIVFIIELRAIGCEDLRTVEGMWARRDGDITTLGCETSQKTWTLLCSGVHWTGVIGNCSQQVLRKEIDIPPIAVQEDSSEVTEVKLALPKEIVLMIIVAVTIVLALIVVTTGYVCYKKASLSTPSTPLPQYELTYNSLKGTIPRHYSTQGSTASSVTYPYQPFTRLQSNSSIVRYPLPHPPRDDGTYSGTETLPLREDEEC